MASLDELKNYDVKQANPTGSQTPAEKLKAMRPTEPVPPRVIIHSFDPDAGRKQDNHPIPLAKTARGIVCLFMIRLIVLLCIRWL